MNSQLRAFRRSRCVCLAAFSSAMVPFLLVHEARGQDVTTETGALAAEGAPSAPPLVLKIQGESPIARDVIEQELSRAVGRPITSEQPALDGMVTLSFDRDSTSGALRVRVSYEPPPDQLVRTDVLNDDASRFAPRIATLVQSLLRQDAGVTIVTPPPPPMRPAVGTAASPPSSESPETPPPKVRLTLRQPDSWRVVAGMRFSAFGSASASGLDGHGRITGDVRLLGGSVQLIAPSFGRLRLGLESVIDSVNAKSSLGNGVTGSLQALYVGVSAMPSLNIWKTRGGFEVNISGHLGVIQTQSVELSGFTTSPSESQSDIGYRAGLALDAYYWLGDHVGVTAAVGLDEVKMDIASFRRADASDATAGAVRNDVRVWVKQPYLRLGATLRF